METIKITALILANLLISNALAYVSTMGRPAINIKPLNCYPCLAFWLTLINGALLACMYQGQARQVAVMIATLSAFLNFFYVKSKYKINE